MAKANVVNTLVVPAESKVYPYYDDFSEDKNFKRILFRPGYAVQARELTQIQTILQNQIERFGQHIFENGSPVIGGDIIWANNQTSITINLQTTYANSAIDASLFKNRTITLASSNALSQVQFQVVQTFNGSNTEPPAIIGTFLLGGPTSIPDSTTIKTIISSADANVYYANVATSGAITANASLAYLRDSIFFFNGFFIKVSPQSTIVQKYGPASNISKSIGLEFNDSIVTEISDSSLLDPAQESFNYQAPGAARYQTELLLSTRSLDSVDKSKFVELARVENGLLKQIIKYPRYSEIEEVLARRTYDESGNYTVRPFSISLVDDSVDPTTYVAARLSPGKAYIYGYEFETIAPTDIRVPRALTKANVRNSTLNLNYGNYVIVDGLSGIFDTTRMQQIDMHCVTANGVNAATETAYNQTKIGTARVRDINFYSGDTDVAARRYEFYIFDTQFRSITSNAVNVGVSSVGVAGSYAIQLFNSASLLSPIANAYQHAILRTSSGQGSGYVYDIASYVATNNTIILGSPVVETIANSTNLAIEFDFNDAYSFVANTNRTAGTVLYNAAANVSILNKSNSSATGETFITEPSLDTLLFPLPESYVANGIYGQSYTYRKRFDSVVFSSGNSVASPIIAASSGGTPLEDFVGGSASSNISSTVMQNFYVVVTALGSGTTRSIGEVLKVRSTVSGSPESVFFDTGSVSDNVTATVFATMQYAANTTSKFKAIVLANTKNFASEAATILTGPTGSTASIYPTTGQVVITNPSRRAGVSESLYLSDVVSVNKIYDLAGASVPAASADLTIYSDVTDRFEFDNGQRGGLYDHASIRLKGGYLSCVGPLIVCCRYYTHSQSTGAGNYFTVDSYPSLDTPLYEDGRNIGTGYTIIPTYTKPDGTKVELRDCIDFRPTRANATNTYPEFAYALNSFSVAPLTIPEAATDFNLNYSYYQGRRDLLVLTGDRILKRIEGIPDKYPQDPAVPSRSMVLYALNVQPYTLYPGNVNARYVENKRYTMRDIGKIEKRVENLEYYVALNNLEKSAVDLPIRDVNGLTRTKYGIFADSFVGHSLGNTDLFDYQCAMNYNEGWLQCKTRTYGFTLMPNTASSFQVSFYRDKVLLTSNEVVMLSQPVASKWAPVAELLYASYNGKTFCLPEADIWKSVKKAPDIIVVDEVNNEYVNFSVMEQADPTGTQYDSIVNSGSRNPTPETTTTTTSITGTYSSGPSDQGSITTKLIE